MDIASVFSSFASKGEKVFEAEPQDIEESLSRLLAVLASLWMSGVEPVAKEMDFLMTHLQNRKDSYLKELSGMNRELVVMFAHQLQKEKERRHGEKHQAG